MNEKKRISCKRFYFSFSIILIISKALSQFPVYPKFKHLTIEDGLPQSGVYYTLQDRNGYIWMITGDGLCKYDGYKFKTFRHNKEDSTSLKPGFLICMAEDKEGYLWLGYRLGGLSKFDPETGKCIHFNSTFKDSSTLSHDDIRALCRDKYGNIYAATAYGLSRINPETNKIKRYYFKPLQKGYAWDENMLWSLFPDDDKLWIGAYREGGLHCFDINKETFTTLKHDPANNNSLNSGYIVGIQKDKKGNLWLSTRSGLCIYDPADNKFTRYYSDQPGNNFLTTNDLWGGLLVDKNDNGWVGSYSNGFTHISGNQKKFTPVLHNPDIPSSLSNNAIRHIFQDASGLIWIGTSNGLNIYDPRHEAFQLIQNVPGVANTLSGKTVNFLMKDENKIWVGIANEGIDAYNTEEGSITHFRNDPKDPNSLPNNNVRSLSKDNNGNYYFVVFGCPSVFKYSEVSRKFQSLGACWGTSSIRDSKNRIWIGTTAGLGTIDSLDKYHTDPNDSTTFAGSVPGFLLPYDENHFWIGAGNVISLFNIHTAKSRRFLFEDRIFDVMKDGKGRWWFSTSAGLLEYDVKNAKTLRRVSKDNGMENDCAVACEEDNNGNLWIATNHGLSCYNPESGDIKNYDVTDGLPNNEFNEASLNENGRLYFATMNGLVSFDPANVKRNHHKAQISITGLTVLNEPFNFITRENKIPAITLNHNQYFFTVEFALLDYSVPSKNKFSYKLEGFDNKWIDIGNKHEVTFTNLNPGDYTLKIKAANNHGVWNEKEYNLNITVLPPWWKTNLFYAIVLIAIVIFIYAFIKWRERKLREEKKMLEEKVKIRTAEVVQQKEIIEEKHKEITDSINYAQRIQRSLLASESILNENLEEYFILFQPKDVVSGDFYWAGKLDNGNFALLTADSTGHGVPGAIMSMLNVSCLEKAIEAEKLSEPSEILNHTRKRIIETLAKDGSAEGGKDGMDCCLVVFNTDKTRLKLAAANNNMWLLRNEQIMEYKADKMPVGRHDKQNVSFVQQAVNLQRGDFIYTFTDGFADQFGGPDGKKFKTARLKQLILSLGNKSAQEQLTEIRNEFLNWRGDNEQVDDVCIIGIRI